VPDLVRFLFFYLFVSRFFVSSAVRPKEEGKTHFCDFQKKRKKNSYSVTGVSLTSELVNFAPVELGVGAVGTTIAAQGVSVNPSVILIQPTG